VRTSTGYNRRDKARLWSSGNRVYRRG